MSLNRVAEPLAGVVYPDPDDLERYVRDGVLTHETLGAGLVASFLRHADRPALVGPEGEVSYRELENRTARLASGLLRLGLKPCDRVLLQLGNSNELIFILVACWRAGLIPICTLAAHREQEIGYIGRHAGACAYIVQGDDKHDLVAFALKMRPSLPDVRHIIVARGELQGGDVTLEQLMDVPVEAAHADLAALTIDPFQVSTFQLSGGTTGVPKIIPRFHNEYLYNMRACAAWNDYSPDDTVFSPLPIVHNATMACMVFPALLSGGRVVIAPRADPPVLLEALARYQPTWFPLSGPMIGRLKQAVAAGAVDFSRVTGIITMNATQTVEGMLQARGVHIFGMTEGVIMFTRTDDPDEGRFGTVGRPVSAYDQVRIIEPGSETDVAFGAVGELAVKGPYTVRGYYDAAEHNSQAFTSDGFYRSGDLMSARRIVDKVYYVFEGRLKEVVDRGGEKINCDEVERALRRHPAIADVAIVAMPDPDYGQRACACIITLPTMQPPSVAELSAFLGAYGLAKFKHPEQIATVAEFPSTKVGKLDRAALLRSIQEDQPPRGTERAGA